MKQISVQEINDLLGYLGKQPYIDVYILINKLAQLQDIQTNEIPKQMRELQEKKSDNKKTPLQPPLSGNKDNK